ncbi:Uncharacterized protein C27B12.07 [Tolypocladium ophioglossoides CBS 100239]|uniref:Uncharacterized protein C27B12.07 n=1 Tax=Tolypocladium ophioglossoides (strain CBS 100239) TaxID=1163406 RepID=A0A0L0NM12_TOLOC|nr:Uncharacterized protein C27B12.07 [Tolypocladium ophioglossoides CBS 100239]
MPAARPLMFLYPQLLRAARAARSAGATGGGGGGWAAAAAAARRVKSSFAPRHGKAVEPGVWEQQQKQQEEEQGQQPLTEQEAPPPAKQEDVEPAPEEPAVVQPEEKSTAEPVAVAEEKPKPKPEEDSETELKQPTETSEPLTSTPPKEATESSQASKEEEERARQTKEEPKRSGPLEAALFTQAPEQVAKQHPHMSPPPYVHHFDSYSLVKQLQEGGYSQEHATTAMKAVRALLAQNLEVAQQSLVSKSDVENETYLFSAACSELSTEIKNNRRLQDEQMRQQRTHLQHEVDILTQSLNQELLTLTDNVRGMFNDRKMAVREEQKAVDSAIQSITYKMSILLSSDSKSEIEGVRWILIRRSVLGIIFMAILTLGVLRYATYVGQQRKKEAEKKKKEAERKKKEKELLRKDGGKTDHSAAADAAAILTAN